MIIHCLPIEVYRNNRLGDCTNKGISSQFETLLMYCPDGHVTFDSDKETPLNFCAMRQAYDTLHIVPAMVDGDRIKARPGWWMYGGNIACTSDSRFYQATQYPVKIHDRREW